MLVQWEGTAAIKLMNNKRRYQGMTIDTVEQTLHFYNWRDSITDNTTYQYTKIGTDSLLLKGRWRTDTLEILMKQRLPKDFPLLNRGFHWISERPYNR